LPSGFDHRVAGRPIGMARPVEHRPSRAGTAPDPRILEAAVMQAIAPCRDRRGAYRFQEDDHHLVIARKPLSRNVPDCDTGSLSRTFGDDGLDVTANVREATSFSARSSTFRNDGLDVTANPVGKPSHDGKLRV